MKSVVIRCAASGTVGFGHLVRCRVLAQEIKNRGYNVIMVGPPSSVKIPEDGKLFTEWFPRQDWLESKSEAEFHLEVLTQYNAKHIIIDDYRSDGEHQGILRTNGIRILQQYDASKTQHFAANFVVNGSPFEKAEFYLENVLYDDIEFLLGPKYAILRPIFSDRKLKLALKEKKLLMTFGGGSDRGAICSILDDFAAVIAEAGWQILVVVGEKNDNIEMISDSISKLGYKHVELFVNPKNMAGIMSKCSFAIMGGGTTIFEAAYLGIPALLIPIADNQINQCKGWESLGGMKYISTFQQFDKDKFQENLLSILNNEQILEKKRKELETVIDADGYKRILDRLLVDDK